jgi:hypothetical protein
MVKFDDLATRPVPCKNYKYLNILHFVATLLLAFHSLQGDFDEWPSTTIIRNVRLEGTVRYERHRVVGHHRPCVALLYYRTDHSSAHREVSVLL